MADHLSAPPLRLGFHVFISGGLEQAARRAIELGCETIQIFSGNPRSWRRSGLDPALVSRFRAMLAEAGISPLFVHVPYLANPAAEDDALWRRSRTLMAHDLERAVELGAGWLVLHIGSSRAAPERAEERVAAAVRYALERAGGGRIALENTAGQGAQVGHDLGQVARIVSLVAEPGRTGVCLDVAHAFEAGYGVGTRAGMDEILALVGRERLVLIHLNDSRTERGSRVDRHWHLGLGRIGEAGIRAVLTHPGLAGLPAVMETPRDAPDADRRNMAVARRLAGAGTENA